MSKMIEIDWNPDAKTLRQFGWIALVGFAFLALIAYMEWLIFAFGLGSWRLPLAGGFAAVGLLAAFFSLVAPRANLPIFVGLTVLAFPIGFVLSYLIMFTLFYLIIAPIGLALRLFGKDPMDLRFRSDLSSYWVDARPARPPESYFRQY